MKLGTLVTGVHYRYPGLLVKTATTLDVLSGGRAYLGIGAGWNERESRGLGVPFPSTRERFERLEETLQIAHQMWSGEVGPYEGEHYQLAEALNSPQAMSRAAPAGHDRRYGREEDAQARRPVRRRLQPLHLRGLGPDPAQARRPAGALR